MLLDLAIGLGGKVSAGCPNDRKPRQFPQREMPGPWIASIGIGAGDCYLGGVAS